jgi:hypothetical protein
MILRTIALAIGLLAATITSQLPEFAQQYRQRLGGAIDELHRIVQRFDTDAGASGLSRDQALNRMQTGPDDFVRRRGVSEAVTMERLARLEKHREALLADGPVRRVGSFLRYGDAELTDSTLRDFEPAVPVTWEGFLSAFVGFLIGWGLIRIVAAPFRRKGPLWRRSRYARARMRDEAAGR